MSSATIAVEAKEKFFTGGSAWEADSRERGGKFLTFSLADQEYGIAILKVQEIIGMMPITRVPRTPDFIRGIINLRGKVVPIVDLRLKFGMEAKAQTEETCMIVVRTGGIEMGVIVDRVSEVLDVPEDEIENAPSFGVAVDTNFILGIGKTAGRINLLLDIDRVLSSDEIAAMQPVIETGRQADESASKGIV